MSDFEGVAVRRRPAAVHARPRRVRVHRIALGQGRAAAVPLLAAQERHRRRRERLRRGAQAQAGGVRRAVRQVPEGALQAVPRQGAARPTTAATCAEARARRRSSSVVSIEPSPLGRPHRRRGRQPQGPGARHHPALDEGRPGHPQPDEGFDKDRGFEYIAHAGRPPRQPRALDRRGRRSATASRTSPAPRRRRR